MGSQMAKPVTSVVVERSSGSLFRVGMAEMNGWRNSMEDAHLVHMQDAWGFFGVFDGHGGAACSAWIASHLKEHLEAHGEPEDDAAMKALALRLDADWLDTKKDSGSTGTFVIVRPADESGKFRLRVGNIGDSRVLLGRADGTIVEGPGTDSGLTTDHKPNLASEQERIVRCGGRVELKMGVPRVNGDLAVSRAFGDRNHKMTGGPAQEDHPVSAEPEFTTIECDATDFIMLVCDGISEGNFPNAEVVGLAAAKLRANGNSDPAEACTAVCRQAIDSGSKDNLSCMIVLLGGGTVTGAEKELLPGPFALPIKNNFKDAYEKMAQLVGYTLPQALEFRYDVIRRELEKLRDDQEDPALTAELQNFREGPPGSLTAEERTDWFAKWLEQEMAALADDQGEQDSSNGMLRMLSQNPALLQSVMAARAGAMPKQEPHMARVASAEELKPAIDSHEALQWSDQYKALCEKRATVVQEDNKDGTSQILCAGIKAWVPTSSLTKLSVRVAPMAELEAHILNSKPGDVEGKISKERCQQVCGQVGTIVEEDQDKEMTHVKFAKDAMLLTDPGEDKFDRVWLPTASLIDI